MGAGGAGVKQDNRGWGVSRISLICYNYCPDSENTQLHKSVTFCFDPVSNVI